MTLLTILTASEGGGGLNPFDPTAGGGLLWTWIIFLVALVPMWKVVLGPVSRALDSRDEMAQRKITAAEEASEAAEKARAEVEIKLGEARAEAGRLMNEARERAGVREREIIEAANHESRELIESARRSIRAEQEKAIGEIRDTVVDLTLEAASKVLGRTVDSADDRRMVESLVSEVKEQA